MGGVLAAARRGGAARRPRGGAADPDAAWFGAWSASCCSSPRRGWSRASCCARWPQPSSALDTDLRGAVRRRAPRVCAHLGRRHRAGRPSARRCASRSSPPSGRSSTSTSAGRWCERRMGWPAIGAAEAEAIADTIVRNLDGPARRRPEGPRMTGFLCALPLIAGLLGCAAPGRAGRRLCRGRVRQPRAGRPRPTLAEVGVAPGRPGGGRPDRRPAGARPTPRSRWPRPRRRATRPRPSSPTCARAAGPRRSRVTEAALEAAQVRLREAERQADRQTALAERGVVRAGRTSTPRSPTATPRGPRWRSSRRELAVAAPAGPRAGGRRRREPARGRRGRGARRRAGGSTSATSPRRPTATVTDVFRRAGEIAGPTAPVLSLLPDGAFKLVVFVGETADRRHRAGRPAGRALRRLPGRPDRHRLLRRRRAGVHPAGDLLGREPPEARLPRRGAARRRTARACSPGRSSMSRLAD